MRALLLAGVGGFIGAAGRYAVGAALLRAGSAIAFPLATLTVNVAGSFAIGVVLGSAAVRNWLSADLHVFLLIGVLGGFTTFSSFSAETLQLWREVSAARAVSNVALNVALGLSAVCLGDLIGRLVRS